MVGTGVVVTLDGRVVPPSHPIVDVAAPMVARGDGVFETLLVRNGRARLLAAHLDRLVRSSAILGLPPPDPGLWRAAAVAACAAWQDAEGADAEDAVLRMVYGRGAAGEPTGLVTVSTLPPRVHTSRRDGVSAVTLDRGVTAAGDVPPWSLAGAKSLSYALNAAALRHAERLGVGEVVLTSSDGFVLEGPRSSVVIADRNGVLATPPPSMPILPGITVRAVFAAARAQGMPCDERPLRMADLDAAQALWLLSSITLAARVHTLDGLVLPSPSGIVDMASLVDRAMAEQG
jgi:4-amino-4-deoxychorismate lyase